VPESLPQTGAHANVEVRRSARRRRTVSAYRDGDRTIVLVPARLSRAEEARWVETMLARLAKSEARRDPGGDEDLRARAARLSDRWLEGRARPSSVRWVGNQGGRWGSCTPEDGTIRLSDRMRKMPEWVVDYVLVHELAHLLVADHSPAFWQWVERYPKTERARGYLLAMADAATAAPQGIPAAEPSCELGRTTAPPGGHGPPRAPRRPAVSLGQLEMEW
jgi:predicted metal-dependent hydrolase